MVSDCSRHIGPGYRVGYQVQGDKRHDDACQLIYVTDGTMINWLREGRLNTIGTVIVDEAHERSTNIDFILGFLKREIDRYPHLRVIVTSATFDVDFYEDFFGGSTKVQTMTVPAAKAFGYGAPFFPSGQDGNKFHCSCELVAVRPGAAPAMPHGEITDYLTWRNTHWPETCQRDDGVEENLWAITDQLADLRFDQILESDNWPATMSLAVASQVVHMVETFDQRGIYGDILAFLPNKTMIKAAVEYIEQNLSAGQADIFGLIQSAPTEHKEAATAARPPGAKRKIVIATNLAETSLTVSGVRFVVDSGLTTQSEWNPELASKKVPTQPHSRAGLRQRWGRVGRDMPGWVFPLYTKASFSKLPADTRPGSTRENLEQLVAKTKAAGIDDVGVEDFPWPAAHQFASLDDDARRGSETFGRELERAQAALVASGAVDHETGHLTPFGKELDRFGHHSANFAVATMSADQLACAPEVITALVLLDAEDQIKNYERVTYGYLFRRIPKDMPAEWRYQSEIRHAALKVGCCDDLDVVVRVVAAWERADPLAKPWEPSAVRQQFADAWWLDHDVLLQAAELRRDALAALSPALKEDVKRFLDQRLVPRARAAITRAYAHLAYLRLPDGTCTPVNGTAEPARVFGPQGPLEGPASFMPLRREGSRNVVDSIVEVVPWAVSDDAADTFGLLLNCAAHCPVRSENASTDQVLPYLLSWPVGMRVALEFEPDGIGGQRVARRGRVLPGPGFPEWLASGSAPTTGASGRPSIWPTIAGSGEEQPWPSGTHQPIDDADPRWEVNELDSSVCDDATGRPVGHEVNDDDDDEWPLYDHLSAAFEAARPDVLTPLIRIEVELDQVGRPDRFTVVGYDLTSDGVVLRVTPDMLPDFAGDPAVNGDLELGSLVPITVGPVIRVGRRPYRSFVRDDGLGCFLLIDAGRNDEGEFDVPVSLRVGNRDFLTNLRFGASLLAEVVPGPVGTRSISLLRTLDEHVAQGLRVSRAETPPVIEELAGHLPAIVTSVAVAREKSPGGRSSGGRQAEVALLWTDSSVGITHTFNIVPGLAKARWITGRIALPVLVRLRHHSQSLRLELASDGDRELGSQLSAVVDNWADFLECRLSDDRLEVTSRATLSEKLRDELASLRKDEVWCRKVWCFYLRSYARQVDAIIASTGGQMIELPLASLTCDSPRVTPLVGSGAGSRVPIDGPRQLTPVSSDRSSPRRPQMPPLVKETGTRRPVGKMTSGRLKRSLTLTLLVASVIGAVVLGAIILDPPKKPRVVAPSSVVAVISLGKTPSGIAVAPDGRQVYVSNHEAILVIDTTKRSVSRSIKGTNYPSGGVTFTRDGTRAYATNGTFGSVSVIDTASGTVIDTILDCLEPNDVTVSANGDRAYVSTFYSRSVLVVDTASSSVIDRIILDGYPSGIAVSPDGRYTYVATSGGWESMGWISVIDNESRSVVDTISVDRAPNDIALTPDGSRAYVTNVDAGQVSVIDLTSNSVDEAITTGSLPRAVAVSSDGSLAYVTNGGSNSVSVIDTGTNSIVDTISTGDGPGSISLTRDGQYAYVTHGSGALSVIGIGAN